MREDSKLIEVPKGKLAAVVTSLEMLAKPPHTGSERIARDVAAWTLRRVGSPALAWYRSLFQRIGEPWLWFSRLAMSDDGLRAVIGDPRVEIYALSLNGEDEGLLELDFRVEGECELSFFGLTESLLGKGAGRWMMERALEIVWSRPTRRFWVHTCTNDHPGALAFYRRTGFVPFRRQLEIADDPRLTGVLRRDAAPWIPII